MRLDKLMEQYYPLRNKVKRARHLYALFCKKQIELEGTLALRRAAIRAMKIKLWATINVQDVEYSILRHMCKIDGYNVKETLGTYRRGIPGWHEWLKDKGWDHPWSATGWIRKEIA